MRTTPRMILILKQVSSTARGNKTLVQKGTMTLVKFLDNTKWREILTSIARNAKNFRFQNFRLQQSSHCMATLRTFLHPDNVLRLHLRDRSLIQLLYSNVSNVILKIIARMVFSALYICQFWQFSRFCHRCSTNHCLWPPFLVKLKK